jgi:hypothetical protein
MKRMPQRPEADIQPSDTWASRPTSRNLATPPELEKRPRGVLAGVKAENISIRDRGVLSDSFQKAGAGRVRPMRTHD